MHRKEVFDLTFVVQYLVLLTISKMVLIVVYQPEQEKGSV